MKKLNEKECETVVAHLEHGLLEIVTAYETDDGIICMTVKPTGGNDDAKREAINR